MEPCHANAQGAINYSITLYAINDIWTTPSAVRSSNAQLVGLITRATKIIFAIQRFVSYRTVNKKGLYSGAIFAALIIHIEKTVLFNMLIRKLKNTLWCSLISNQQHICEFLTTTLLRSHLHDFIQ
jgi:hypothetical protein